MFMSKVLAKYAQYYNYKIIEMVMYFKTALEVNVLKVNGILELFKIYTYESCESLYGVRLNGL